MKFKQAKDQFDEAVASDNGSIADARTIMWTARKLAHAAELQATERVGKESEKQFGFEQAKHILGI